MPKIQQSVGLPPEVWVQIDELIGYFGESRGEIITHVMNVWFRSHGKEIQDERIRIDALRSKTEAFLRDHPQVERKRKENKNTPE